MPLTEHTEVKDEHQHVIEKRDRKLYSLVELRDRPDEEIETQAFDRALDWMREGQFDYDWWDAALDTIYEVFEVCGFTFKQNDVEFDLDRGSKFVLPRNTSVDEKVFLKALKVYLSGTDVRVALLDYTDTPENAKRAVKAVGSQIRNLDLRSKDARIIREQGIVVLRVSGNYSRSDEFDIDYHYEGLSEQFKEDANEFLADLCHHALGVLRDEMDYLGSEENLLEHAEANELFFDKTGRRA